MKQNVHLRIPSRSSAGPFRFSTNRIFLLVVAELKIAGIIRFSQSAFAMSLDYGLKYEDRFIIPSL
ncbi:MAG: hypothetical protein K0M63_09825 [Weeksellaceae bacterium]|nr:hypothetical protein [Weeksellaceae bacterium]